MKVRLAIYTMITLAPILSQMASSTQETTDAARKLTMESKKNAFCSTCKLKSVNLLRCVAWTMGQMNR